MTDTLINQLSQVQQSTEINMYDVYLVRRWAYDLDLHDLVHFISAESKEDYWELLDELEEP